MADFMISKSNSGISPTMGWNWKQVGTTVTKTELPGMGTHTEDVTLEKGTYLVHAEYFYEFAAGKALSADMMNASLIFVSDTTAKNKITMPGVTFVNSSKNYAKASTSSVITITENIPKLSFRMGKTDDKSAIADYSTGANIKFFVVTLVKING